MRYEMKDASYSEYAKFCASENIAPISCDAFDWKYWIDFCRVQQISHSVTAEAN